MSSAFSVSSLDELRPRRGFRNVRTALGIAAFQANSVVLAAGKVLETHSYRTEQLYLVQSGTVRVSLGSGDETEVIDLEPGGLLRTAPGTLQRFEVIGDTEAVYFSVGVKP